MASGAWAPGVGGRIASYTMSSWQPGRSSSILTTATQLSLPLSMPAEPQRRERQTSARKSDCPIVPTKPGNSGGGKGAEPPQLSSVSSSAHRGGRTVAARLESITRRARVHPREVFTNLAHHLDNEMFKEAFRELKGGKAPGVDGVTKAEYGEALDDNIVALVERLKRDAYHPQPSRRREIPKGNGKTRPLGIPSLEDKLVQRALTKVLERVYEEKFCDFSYGFRPGRSCHDALKGLSRVIGTKKVGYVVEADIKGFFDHVDFAWLERMVQHRIQDPAVLLLIRRFLRAGVLKDGRLVATTEGTPQGGVVSPLLANIYLHYVLDIWFAKELAPSCRGEAYLIRYADDFVACFQYEDDAVRFFAALPERLAKFKLEVAAEKTRMLEFGRFARRDAERRGERKTATFDFLGFTHFCGRSRKGRFKLKWRTSKARYRKALRSTKEWLKLNRYRPLREIWADALQKLRGHNAYYGVSDNSEWLHRYRDGVLRQLYYWLNRRSQRRSFTWAKFYAYVDAHPLSPAMRIVNLNSAYV
jgi:RNA-directed DNA polymerase